MIKAFFKVVLVCMVFLVPGIKYGFAQLHSLGHHANAETQLPSKDSIYIYCASGPDDRFKGRLEAKSPFDADSDFKWEKFDTISGQFIELGNSAKLDSVTSRISQLDNGLYQVTISDGSSTFSQKAWVLHNWITAQAEIPDSTSICEYFKIEASYNYAPLHYYDVNTLERINIRNPEIKFRTQWFYEGKIQFSIIDPYVYDPPASDSPVEYKLVVTDMQFGCTGGTTAFYDSKVTEAAFAFDPQSGEAVLTVNFTNNSINYTGAFWHFSKELDFIKAEIAKNPNQPYDSIDFVLTDRTPVYDYEWSGTYKVFLVTVKENPTTGNCYDTIYMNSDEKIEALLSLIEVPNVFTPNGDGVNDEFVVFTQSLRSMNFQIFNRWGGVVHRWNYSNIRGSDYTHEHSVWDGRVNGGAMASPGVYFYVVQAVGRDGAKIKKEGFLHLFRDRN